MGIQSGGSKTLNSNTVTNGGSLSAGQGLCGSFKSAEKVLHGVLRRIWYLLNFFYLTCFN